MGRIYLEHLGGIRLFSCAQCDTFLTNRNELISTRFTGATGRAFLFKKVVNVIYDKEREEREMLTGMHYVRDVSCKYCKVKLGWFYEFATEENQRYKEGQVILERALINEHDGIKEYVPTEDAGITVSSAPGGGGQPMPIVEGPVIPPSSPAGGIPIADIGAPAIEIEGQPLGIVVNPGDAGSPA